MSGFMYVYVQPKQVEALCAKLEELGFQPNVVVYTHCTRSDFQAALDSVIEVVGKPPRFMQDTKEVVV